MNNVELKKIIDNHQHWINEDCGDWQDLRATLRGADLHGANLREADLREADLHGANLYGANLHGVNLREADLREADLRRANLRRTNLRRTNLHEANLYEANLREADLNYSCLPLVRGSLEANFDSKQLKQIAYHLVKAGLHSKNATEEDKMELRKLIDYANQFHRAEECGIIEIEEDK